VAFLIIGRNPEGKNMPGKRSGEKGRIQKSDIQAIDQRQSRRMFYYMLLTRELEDRIENKLYRQGKILGSVYVGRGQEAIGVGSCIQTRPDDVICPSHRDMGAFLIRGMLPQKILAQYMGRRDGYTCGKDGNLHMGDLSHNVIAFVSMLADSVPVAAGIGMAFKMRKEDRIVLCYFGEGASSRGDWHEGLNLAAVHKLPVVFICNNNQYAYSTPLHLQMPVKNIADRASAYGMPGILVDGNDVLAVYQATKEAIRRARGGLGPSLLECKTFRMTGHAAHDDGSYVPKELFEEWGKKDPICRFRQVLLDAGIMSPDSIQALLASIAEEVDTAVEWAENCAYPEPEEVFRGVYAQSQ
jgi:TPP-dependent pyruvate/acetoin dehydrogenase alpha subunit